MQLAPESLANAAMLAMARPDPLWQGEPLPSTDGGDSFPVGSDFASRKPTSPHKATIGTIGLLYGYYKDTRRRGRPGRTTPD